MDTKSFLKEIRSIIREEIDYALDKRLKKQQKPVSEQVNHGVSLYKQAISSKPQQKQQKTKPSSGGNSLSIQQILEETRRSLDESVRFDEDYGGNELTFTSDSLNAFAAERHQPTYGAIPSGVNPADLAPEVANALTRDYSALMQRIKEKKGE